MPGVGLYQSTYRGASSIPNPSCCNRRLRSCPLGVAEVGPWLRFKNFLEQWESSYFSTRESDTRWKFFLCDLDMSKRCYSLRLVAGLVVGLRRGTHARMVFCTPRCLTLSSLRPIIRLSLEQQDCRVLLKIFSISSRAQCRLKCLTAWIVYAPRAPTTFCFYSLPNHANEQV